MRCPDCNRQLDLKLCSKGVFRNLYFWGCTNFPNCHFILNTHVPENEYTDQIKMNLDIFHTLLREPTDEVVNGFKANMGLYLEHFITCRWGAHFNDLFDNIIQPYFDDVNLLKFILKSDIIRSESNIIVSDYGEKIFYELFRYLVKVEDKSIKEYLASTFPEFNKRFCT
ncbi:MAG: topoisomerase DNA-binding C4 zinc finger domain-containing protein [Candidatus Brocadiales bacterium]|nr:topoisomerase DNA-binding C4 zinc finger domain-containing protein [Candidatus Brocadiales bacterium]